MLSGAAPIRVRMEKISKSFGAIKSLDQVNLLLHAGEVLGLVGDNGAGKSTLSKILSGATIPDSGQIFLDEREVRFGSPADARRQRVEMVYQDLSLCDTIDVAGNLLLGREPVRRVLGVPLMDKPKMHAEAAVMLGHLGIRMPSTRLKVENLSGGQRQSIAIGRAVSFDPLVLIMDEPTAALAVAEVDAVLELIKTVSSRGVSVILITHRLQDLFVVCDRIMVLFEGRNAAERLVGETNIEEIVNLIVGRKFRSVSAAGRAPKGTLA
jgi:simple sugar transport system ATP-binding protein